MPIVLNGTSGDISGSSLTGIDTGKILQVKQTVKTSLFSSSTNNSQVDVTGVNVSITPSSASNKILVICSGDYGNDNNDSFQNLYLSRTITGGSTTDVVIGDTRGSATRATMNATLRSGGGLSHNVTRHFSCHYLDSPNTTSAIEYKLRMLIRNGTGCIGGSSSSNDAWFTSTPTFITAMEVAA